MYELICVGASWGGDLGSPFFRFARDRVRFAVRLTLDMAVIRHELRSNTTFDLDWATFALGPQLWLRVSPHAYNTREDVDAVLASLARHRTLLP